MGSLLEKLGLYDFMGIWGPGAICVTYFGMTLYQPIVELGASMGLSSIEVSSNYILLILYTVVAYIVGMILNELGRVLADMFGLFRAEKEQASESIVKKPNRFRIFRTIRYRYQITIQEAVPEEEYCQISFNTIRVFLKNDKNVDNKIYDTLHSIYAMARSVATVFMLHALTTTCFIMRGVSISYFIPAIDCILCVAFFYRTYKYYYAWIQNVFISYYRSISRQ